MSDTPRKVPPEYAHIPAYAYEDLWEYHLAVSGEGPHAYTWEDKPHRLVFGLTARCADLRRENAALRAELEGVRKDAAMMDLLEVYMVNGKPRFAVHGYAGGPDYFDTARAAIDAAIARGKGEK